MGERQEQGEKSDESKIMPGEDVTSRHENDTRCSLRSNCIIWCLPELLCHE
jgi:hypothetical protein